MSTESQLLVDAVEAGEMTDAGGMTTTQDVADVVPYAYDTADEKLHALASDGVIERTTFGNEHVWNVPDDSDDGPDESTQVMPTSTRGPVEP